MQQFQINGIDDLVSNQSFKRWILTNNAEDGLYWNQWAAQHPEKLEWLAAAKEIILILADGQSELPAERVNAAAAKIRLKIQQLPVADDSADAVAEPAEPQYPRPSVPIRKAVKWLVAASVIAAIAASVFIANNSWKHSTADSELAMFTTSAGDSFFENNIDSVKTVSLSDGSTVALYKGGKLRFSTQHDSARREAFLSGSAFFSVAHNPSKPFIVYTKNIVAKVLGTSFTVKAMPNESTAIVAVATGKVSVFKKEKFKEEDAKPGVLEGLIITPNQQASYEATKGTISKALVALPAAVGTADTSLVFDATPAVAVFKKLQELYGIPIVIDEAALASCSINASFKRNETFYEKLSIICQTINASYQIVDASIVVSAQGCR